MSVILKIVLPLVLTLGLVDCSSSDTKKTDKLPKTDAKTQITYPVNSAEDPVEIDVPVVPPIVPPPILPVGPIDGSARTGNKDNDDSCNDSDADGVCDGQDACVGFDDNLDADQDGYPTACDCDDTDASVFPGVECNPSAVPNEECRYLICRVSLDRGGNQVAYCANEPKEDFTLCGNEPLGLCDKQDYCHSGECIDDQQPITYQCNNDLTECDVPDYCDGVNDDCPRTYVVAGIPCGNPAAEGAACDAQDECDGAGNCIDEVQNNGFVCGVNSGTGCDITDVCNGFDKDCFNAVLASGTLCGNSAQGECDLHDVCNSQGECLDIKRLSDDICEFSHGICQPGSRCDGVNNNCPFAAATPPGVPCGPNNLGVCTGQGRCTLDSCPNATGLGVDLDLDGFSTDCDCNDANAAIFPGTVCAAGGPTDCSETICNFATAACDIISNYSQGTICGPDQPANSCTKNPICDGNGTCLNNEFQASDYPCRLSTGVCDAEEFCTGMSGTCPVDSFIPQGTVCGNESDLCLSAGTCDGSTASCSNTVNAPDGDTNALCIAGINLPSPIVSSDHCPGTQNGSYVCSQGVAYCYADNAVELNLSCYGDDNYNIDSGNFANDNTNHPVQGGDNLGWSEAAYGNYVASGAPSYDLPSNGDDIGAVFLSTVDAPSAASLNNLIIPNPNTKPNGNNLSGNESENFGYSVALHGDYLIVGAPNADYYYDSNILDSCPIITNCLGSSYDNAGAAYIFVRNGVNWDFQAKLQGSLVRAAGNLYPTDVGASDAGLNPNDQFGFDVAINGDYAIVSAPSAEGAHTDVGNVRVYHRTGSTWSYLQIIGTPIDQNSSGEKFGYALALSPNGQALAISSPFYDNTANDNNDDRGIIYLYTSNGVGGTFSVVAPGMNHFASLTGNNGGDQLGFDVSLSNNFIVYGIPHADIVNGASNNGFVVIRSYDSLGFTLANKGFSAPATQASQFFGTSVSIGRSDDHAFVVGSPYYDSSEGDDSGLIAVYSINQSMNTITPADFNLVSYVDGDDYVAGSSQFGYSVATDSNIVGVGAPLNDSHSNSDSGSTSLFFYPY